MANYKISAMQMAFLLYPTVLATGFMVLPSFASQYAENDYWMTGLLGGIMGVVAIGLSFGLHALYPKSTVVESAELIVGRMAGKIIGGIYSLVLMHTSGIILREYAEFVKSNFLFKTPIIFVMISMLALCACAVRGGIEVIARGAVLFTPLFVIPLFILLMLIPDLSPGNMLPILSHGLGPVLQGSIMPSAWMSELFLMSFMLPSLTNQSRGKGWGFITLAAIVLSVSYINLITLLLMNIDTSDKMYPLLVAFRFISIGGFFENLEALLLAMWVVGSFVKLSVFLYCTVVASYQSAGLSDYRYIVLPISVVVVIFAFWDLPNLVNMSHLLVTGITFELLVVMIIIPLLLYTIAKLRGRDAADEGGLGR